MSKAADVQVHDQAEEDQLNTTINTTPLVDVMLVLLIIFLVTIPVILKTVQVQLPNVRNLATVTKPENIVIAVTANGDVYYNNVLTDISQVRPKLVESLQRAISAGSAIPELHIRGDKGSRFQDVGRVILAAQQAGIPKVGFITLPQSLN
jgi:biopolymer transport protein ExbD